jgi:hypothetical protein
MFPPFCAAKAMTGTIDSCLHIPSHLAHNTNAQAIAWGKEQQELLWMAFQAYIRTLELKVTHSLLTSTI